MSMSVFPERFKQRRKNVNVGSIIYGMVLHPFVSDSWRQVQCASVFPAVMDHTLKEQTQINLLLSCSCQLFCRSSKKIKKAHLPSWIQLENLGEMRPTGLLTGSDLTSSYAAHTTCLGNGAIY